MKTTYLATVNKDFKLTEAFKTKLSKKGIDVLSYSENLNVLKLSAEKDICSLDLKPITHIEKDKEFTIDE